MLTRRNAIALGAAAAAVTAIAPVAVMAVPVAPIPAWAVGTPGEFDWIHALGTEHDARIEWLNSYHGVADCKDGGEQPRPECDCEFCANYHGLEVERKECWDGIATPSRADWLRAELGTLCSRCGAEAYREDGSHPIGDEAVCDDCMTPADWDTIDPERAAEMRADLEAEG